MRQAVVVQLVRLLACLSGIVVAYVLASLLHTQTILAALSSVGVVVPLSERLQMSWDDLLGLWRYGLVIALAMSPGFLIMTAVSRRLRIPRVVGFFMGGFAAFATMLLAMEAALSFVPIASARSIWGFLLQCFAGGIGGAVAARNLTIWKKFDSIGTNASTVGRSSDEQRES